MAHEKAKGCLGKSLAASISLIASPDRVCAEGTISPIERQLPTPLFHCLNHVDGHCLCFGYARAGGLVARAASVQMNYARYWWRNAILWDAVRQRSWKTVVANCVVTNMVLDGSRWRARRRKGALRIWAGIGRRIGTVAIIRRRRSPRVGSRPGMFIDNQVVRVIP